MFATLRSLFHWVLGFVVATFWILVIGLTCMVVPARRFHRLWKAAFRSITSAFGMRIVVKGLEHVDPTQGVLYMPNHVNSFEPFIAMPAIPQWVVAVEKIENFKLPIYSILIKSWGNIPIDRNNRENAFRQLTYAKELIASGTCVAIMPEGTRTRNGRLGPFKKGGFHMAIDMGATVVPYCYRGLDTFNRHGGFQLNPASTVEVIFTPPIDASAYTRETMPQLMQRVRSQILEALGQEGDDHPIEVPAARPGPESSETVTSPPSP